MLPIFLKNSAIYSASRFLSRGISLFLVPFYTRVFSPDDYGVMELLSIFITILVLVLPLQITQAVARFYTDADSPDQAVAISSSALIFTFIIFTAFLAIIQVFPAELSSVVLDDPDNKMLIRIVGIALFCNGIFYFLQNQLKWMQKAGKHAIASVLHSFVTIGVTVLCVLLLRTGVVGVFVGQICGAITGSALSLYFGRASYRAVFDRRQLSRMIQYCLPLVPAAFFVYFLGIISRLAIKQFLTLSDLGLFAIGFRVSTAAMIVMVGVTSSLEPMIFSTYREDTTPKSVEKAFRVILLIALAVTISISVFVEEILFILTTPVYYAAGEVVPYLLAAAFIGGFYVFAPGLRIQKKTRIIAWVYGAACIVSIVLNIMLIQIIGIVGAAVASMLSSVFVFGVMLWYSQKLYYIPYTWRRYILPLAIAGFMIWVNSWIDVDRIVVVISLKLLLIAATLIALCFVLTNGIERRAYLGLARRMILTRRGGRKRRAGPS